MCLLRFKNNFLTIKYVRFASILKKTPLLKLTFAFVSIWFPLLYKQLKICSCQENIIRKLIIVFQFLRHWPTMLYKQNKNSRFSPFTLFTKYALHTFIYALCTCLEPIYSTVMLINVICAKNICTLSIFWWKC
jgi:hypothetical protein